MLRMHLTCSHWTDSQVARQRGKVVATKQNIVRSFPEGRGHNVLPFWLQAYNSKHNSANGENNNDGGNDSESALQLLCAAAKCLRYAAKTSAGCVLLPNMLWCGVQCHACLMHRPGCRLSLLPCRFLLELRGGGTM